MIFSPIVDIHNTSNYLGVLRRSLESSLLTVSSDGTTSTYTYDTNGNRTSLTTGSIKTTYTYNKANWATSVKNAVSNVTKTNFVYTYRLDGNQISKTETVTGEAVAYTYNPLGQLICEAYDYGSVTYSYDEAGNRLAETDTRSGDTVITEYAYDDNNRLTSVTREIDSAIEIVSYYYDANGNQVSKMGEWYAPVDASASGLCFDGLYERYTYNKLNQLIAVEADGHLATYTYNPNGLRHSKNADSEKRVHIWDGANIIAETGGNNFIAVYIRGINLLWRSTGTGDQTIYLYNAHGDVVGLVGSLVLEYDYDAFGNELDGDGLPLNGSSLLSTLGVFMPLEDNPFRYCGEYFDDETGTYYLRARYYNPANSRWLSPDTHWNTGNMIYGDNPQDLLGLGIYVPNIAAIMQSGNLYVYCGSNPLMFVDPTGEAWYHWAIGAAIVVGCGIAVVATAGGASLAIIAVMGATYGVAVGSTATTVAAFAFVGASIAFGTSVFVAAVNSNSVQGFNEQGNWGTVAYTAASALLGAAIGFSINPTQKPPTQLMQSNTKSGALSGTKNLPTNVQKSAKSFFEGGSNSYNDFRVIKTSDGNYIATMTKPGNVPGSSAVYTKLMDSNGNTIVVYKTTYDPQGNIVHTKEK